IFHGRQADLLAIDDQGVAVDAHVALETAMHTVVLQHVGEVLGLEQIVDADHLDVLEILNGGAKHHASDAAEAVDADLDAHVLLLKVLNLDVVIAGLTRHSCWRKVMPLCARWWIPGQARDDSTLRTVSATFSGVKPKCLNSTLAGADSP